jgi:hypothetical protein
MTKPQPKTFAQVVLRHAARVVSSRSASYGDAREGFGAVARLWSVILGCRVQAWQVALCLDALKTARILGNPGHADSWIDKCGYSALGAEVAPVARGRVAEPAEPKKDTVPCSSP